MLVRTLDKKDTSSMDLSMQRLEVMHVQNLAFHICRQTRQGHGGGSVWQQSHRQRQQSHRRLDE